MLVALGSVRKGIANTAPDCGRKVYIIVDTDDFVMELVDAVTLKKYIGFLGIKFGNVKLAPIRGHEKEKITESNIDSETLLLFDNVCDLKNIDEALVKKLVNLSLSLIGNTKGNIPYKHSALIAKYYGFKAPDSNYEFVRVQSYAGTLGSDLYPAYRFLNNNLIFHQYDRPM